MNITLLTLAMTVGQPIESAVPPPALPASQFLFVTVTAPGAAKITWQPHTAQATETPGPVGLRPGYPYRFQISNLPGAGNTVLFPSIEVRGSLVPRPGLNDVSKHPVPVTLTEHDLARVLEGRLVTKVYYLEDPEQAAPVSGVAGEPLEGTAESEEEAIKEARRRGRPMLIFRVGERPYTKEELAIENVEGTLLLPGVRKLPVPARPPLFPFEGIIVYDPIIGARGAGEECLKDGGDIGPRVGPNRDGDIGGLNPSDTAILFTTRLGTKAVASNRVCICVPRFAAARVESGPAGHHAIQAPEAHHRIRQPASLTWMVAPEETRGIEQIKALIGSKRASAMEMRQGPSALDYWSGKPLGLSSIKGVAALAQVRGPEEITAFPNCTLILQKSIDPPHPEKIGDVVTVTLRYVNPTTEVMTDVIIADSLTTRLEYVEGSARSSRAATFTATPNEGRSTTLRWAIDGQLKPGESGTITFQVKIR